MNNLKELESKVNTLELQTALNTAHLKSINLALFELADFLLKPEESNSFCEGFLNTLKQKSNEISHQLDSVVDQSKISKELFDLHCYVSETIRQLRKEV